MEGSNNDLANCQAHAISNHGCHKISRFEINALHTGPLEKATAWCYTCAYFDQVHRNKNQERGMKITLESSNRIAKHKSSPGNTISPKPMRVNCMLSSSEKMSGTCTTWKRPGQILQASKGSASACCFEPKSVILG